MRNHTGGPFLPAKMAPFFAAIDTKNGFIVDKLGKVGDDGTWFDTSAFARPTGVRFGNVGRNTMRGVDLEW